MIKVAFRVDASAQVGTGHVTRCLTLANNLRSTGAECYFICRKDQDDLYKKVEGYKFAVYSLPIINKKYKHKIGDSIHASWLGCDWQVDASQTKEHLKHILPDWLVVDHYAIDYRWEIELKQYYKKLMVIDDLADRQHNCDLLLDQNLFLNSTKRYKGLIPDGCIQLLGPQYALLQPEYAKLRSGVYPRNEPHNNLLVFFGGVDQYNLTGMTISALERINIPFKFVNIVISRQSPYYFRLKNQISQFPKVSVYSDLPSLAPLMIKADLAVGAGPLCQDSCPVS